jgi:putative endonuclease
MFGWGSKKDTGDAGEARALAHLQRQGLVLVERNYRVGGGPRRPAGEIDLIVRDRDGTLVFVEVRARRSSAHGGAAATVDAAKQRRLVRAAQHYLLRFSSLPACRFDVVAIDGETLHWIQGAFEAA